MAFNVNKQNFWHTGTASKECIRLMKDQDNTRKIWDRTDGFEKVDIIKNGKLLFDYTWDLSELNGITEYSLAETDDGYVTATLSGSPASSPGASSRSAVTPILNTDIDFTKYDMGYAETIVSGDEYIWYRSGAWAYISVINGHDFQPQDDLLHNILSEANHVFDGIQYCWSRISGQNFNNTIEPTYSSGSFKRIVDLENPFVFSTQRWYGGEYRANLTVKIKNYYLYKNVPCPL